MKIWVSIFAVFAGLTTTLAQSTASTGEPIFVNVNSSVTNKPLDPGTYISPEAYQSRVDKFIPSDFKFDNTSFVNGYLFFSSGRRSALMKLNYNNYMHAMFFIDNSKDTFQLFPSPDLKYIITENKLYYHDVLTGIYEVAGGKNGHIKLAKRKVFIQSEVQPLVGEKSYSENYSNETAMYIEYTPHDHKQAKQKITFIKESHFFLTDETDNIVQANRKGFFKMFPSVQDEVKKYLKSQSDPINFNDEKDLVRLVDYCNGLIK